MNNQSPYPVTIENGFHYFQLPNGRQAAVVMVDGQLVYARDFAPGCIVDDVPMEPNDFEWMLMVNKETNDVRPTK